MLQRLRQRCQRCRQFLCDSGCCSYPDNGSSWLRLTLYRVRRCYGTGGTRHKHHKKWQIEHFKASPATLMVAMGSAEIAGAIAGAGIGAAASVSWKWKDGSMSQIAASWLLVHVLHAIPAPCHRYQRPANAPMAHPTRALLWKENPPIYFPESRRGLCPRRPGKETQSPTSRR